MITLEKVIDDAVKLPLEQQRTLVDILQHCYIDKEREQIAIEAQQSLIAFQRGDYRPQTAEEVINELRALVEK